VNAVPPLGVSGTHLQDFGAPLTHAVAADGAVGIGALAIGHIKYRTQQALLKLLLETDKSVFIDFREAFVKARYEYQYYYPYYHGYYYPYYRSYFGFHHHRHYFGFHHYY